MKKGKLKVIGTLSLSLLLAASTLINAFAADSVQPASLKTKIAQQVDRINNEVAQPVTGYKLNGNVAAGIETYKTTPHLRLDTATLSPESLDFYSSMSDEDIYNYLHGLYEDAVRDIEESNDLYKIQLEQQVTNIKTLEKSDSAAPRTGNTAVTRSRTYEFNTYVSSAGYAKMRVSYNVTCRNNLFIRGNVTGCRMVDHINLASWEYEGGSTYPLIETDNGRYIAFQVVGIWTVGLENGIGIASEHWYDFTDENPF